jgi:hypothetical protein
MRQNAPWLTARCTTRARARGLTGLAAMGPGRSTRTVALQYLTCAIVPRGQPVCFPGFSRCFALLHIPLGRGSGRTLAGSPRALTLAGSSGRRGSVVSWRLSETRHPPQDANIRTYHAVAAAVQYGTSVTTAPSTRLVIVTAETCSSKSQPVQGVAYRVQNIATAP